MTTKQVIKYLYFSLSLGIISVLCIKKCEEKKESQHTDIQVELLRENIISLSQSNRILDSINNVLLIELTNLQVKKDTIKIRYERKINSIDTLNISDVANKFQLIFSKHGVN